MDNANLSSLKLSPSHLTYYPSFHEDTCEYSLVVPSDLVELSLKLQTSDTSASFVIKHDTKDGCELKLKDGLNSIKIEVSSEDGTLKVYTLNVKKLSASDAFLKNIAISEGLILKPSFNSELFAYTIENVSCELVSLKVNVEVEDEKCEIKLICNEKEILKTKDTQMNVDLNYGRTKIDVLVTSPNKTNTKIYTILVKKSIFTRFLKFKNLNDFLELEDPISLSPLFSSITIKSTSNTYSQIYAQFFLNQYKQDYLSGVTIENFNSSQIANYKLDHQISNAEASIPLINGEYFNLTRIALAGNHLSEINKNDQLKQTTHVKFLLDYDSNIIETSFKYEIKKWEEKFFQIYDEFDPDKLLEHSRKHQEEYLRLLSQHDSRKTYSSIDESPLYFLNLSIFTCATAIKHKKQNHELHFRLAMLLEEKHFLEEVYGLKDDDGDESSVPLLNANQAAKCSSKEEEINAICKLRNVDANSSVERKLKALDEEYHHLLESGQTFKAEQVQSLYLFKVQSTKMDASVSSKVSDNETYLGQAYSKYADALALSEASKITKYLYHFHMGRMHCIRSNAHAAIKNLTVCLQWNDEEYKILVRFYLGYALSLDKSILASRHEEAVFYLCTGLQHFLDKFSFASNVLKLYADNLFSILNLTFLQAFFNLGSILKLHKLSSFTCLSPTDSNHYCALLCSQALYWIFLKTESTKKLAKSSETVKQICWLLVGAHYALIELLESHPSKGKPLLLKLIEKRCFYLSALLKNINKNDNQEVLNLQETICQKLVKLNPSDNYFLFLLGNAQFEKYDCVQNREQDNALLDDCKKTLLASIQLDDKPASGEAPTLIAEQNWWIEMNKLLEKEVKQELAKIEEPTKPQTAIQTKSSAPAKQPLKLVAKAPTVKTIQSNKVPPGKKVSEKLKNDANCRHCKPSEDKQMLAEVAPPLIVKEPQKVEDPPVVPEMPSEPIKINKKIVASRLVLARVYTRLKDIDNAKNMYNQALELEPSNYDAAIELAEMLKKNGDAEGAVDVYTRFKTDFTTLTYDDAFIFGEIVNALMKAEKYDDPRLVKYSILWARVMGIGILEKYIKKLDEKNRVKSCKEIYCGVHMKDSNDADLIQFFKFKGWNT